MRCLTLADALRSRGALCQFICREHPGNLLDVVRQRGFTAVALPRTQYPAAADTAADPPHAAWVGAAWEADAQQTLAALGTARPDWLVVDHYGLDERWESAVGPHCGNVLVIDDLADRPHACNLLLDQNLGREPQSYAALLPASEGLLIGPRFALLRPEFAACRQQSLARRNGARLAHLLVAMGGADQHNATGLVLEALAASPVPPGCRVTVVLGPHAPWLEQVRAQAVRSVLPITVLCNVRDMASLMADADAAIGAAGCTSWERCCLGVPALIVVLAANQMQNAVALQKAGAVDVLSLGGISQELPRWFANLSGGAGASLAALSASAARIVDGLGTERVCSRLLEASC